MATSTVPTLDLRATIQDAIDNTDLASPRDLADHLIDNVLAPSEYEDALRLALPNLVREQVRLTRDRVSQTGSAPLKSNGAQRILNNSPKRQADDEILRIRVFTKRTGWILFGDATRENVADIVIDYRERATSNEAAADSYQRVLDLFDANKRAKTVRDLSLTKVKEVLN